MNPRRQLLHDLSCAAGPPGAEDEVRSIFKRELEPISALQFDRLGSVIAELQTGDASGPRVVLDAHMDEVGFMIQSVEADGRIAFVPLGGWWGHVLLGQRVRILTSDGTSIPGIIGGKPPHFLTPAEREKVQGLDMMAIDVGGNSDEDVEKLGVRVGDVAVPESLFIDLGVPNRWSGKALDDRVGCGVLIETMKKLARTTPPNQVVAVGAVQEEVGCRGAITSSEIARPDVAIVLEGTPADDVPTSPTSQGALGSGPQLRFADPTAIANRAFVRHVESVASRREIPLQRAVRRSGGTNASRIHLHGTGVPTVVIGVPARYIHTHAAIIDADDYDQTIELVASLVGSIDSETAGSFSRFDG